MNNTLKVFILLLVVTLFAVPSLAAQNVTIDARFGISGADGANYFNWAKGSQLVKDSFDAASGASLSGSTQAFNDVRYDGKATKKATIPVALRGLLLYPVSDYQSAKDDAFTVSTTGKAVTVRFVHYGVAYEIATDANGKFDVLTGAKFAKGLAENIGGQFSLKKEFVKAGGDPAKMENLDWSKVAFVPDAKDVSASRWYEGKLDIKVSSGVLLIKGTLAEKKAK